jgi:hypothetical protein
MWLPKINFGKVKKYFNFCILPPLKLTLFPPYLNVFSHLKLNCMTSTNAKLKFNKTEDIDVLKCSYELNRQLGPKGNPVSRVYGGTIHLTVESTDDTSILESMIAESTPIDGSIKFMSDDEKGKGMKELSWTKGYVVKYQESIDVASKEPMSIHFTVSAEEIKVGNAKQFNDWSGKNTRG